MKVYLDLVILINFLIDYLTLLYTAIIQKKNINNKRILLATLFASTSLGLFIINSFILFLLLRFLYSILIIRVAYKWNNIRVYILDIIIFYFLNFSVAGLIISMNLKINSTITIPIILLISSIMISITLVFIFINNIKIKTRDIRSEYMFSLDDINFYNGFLDTGNVLYTKKMLPVIFVNEKIIEHINYDEEVKINQFGTIVTKRGFYYKTFIIIVNNTVIKKPVFIVPVNSIFENKTSYNAILHADII